MGGVNCARAGKGVDRCRVTLPERKVTRGTPPRGLFVGGSTLHNVRNNAGVEAAHHAFTTGMASHSVVYLGDLYALADCHADDCPATPKLIEPGP